MKRLIAIALMGLFAFAIGCGGASEPAPATPDEAAESAAGGEEGAAMEEAPAEEAPASEEAAPAEEGMEGEGEAEAPAE